jgi:nucleoside-diphosphate-sugar epimerase
MAKKNVIMVVGGTGTIGSEICGDLLRRGRRVICVDPRKFRGGESDREFFMEQLGGNLTFIGRPVESLRHGGKRGPWEDVGAVVVAAASPIEIDQCELRKGAAFGGHLNPLMASIEFANLVGAGVLYLSSAAIYGEGFGKGKLSEDNALRQPPTFYGLLKSMGEQLVDQVTVGAGVSARIFNVRPKGCEGGSVWAQFRKDLAAGRRAEIHGSGLQERDYMNVEEVGSILGTLAVAIADERIDESSQVNVCTGESMSVIDVAKEIGVDYETSPDGGHGGGMTTVVGDPKKLNSWLSEVG